MDKFMYKLPLTLIVVLLFAGCSSNPQTKPFEQSYLNKRVYIVLDYVEYRDDIGKLLRYNLHLNNKRLKSLQTQIENLLIEKGYTEYQFIFASSGIDFNPEANFISDGNKKTDALISPPFIQSTKFNDETLSNQLIAGFKVAQEAASFKKHKNVLEIGQFPIIKNTHDSAIESFSFKEDSLILYARVLAPEISFGKKFMVGTVTGALTLAVTGGSSMLVTTPYGPTYSNMVLVNNTNGEFLWRGKVNMNLTHLTKKKLFELFASFPAKP